MSPLSHPHKKMSGTSGNNVVVINEKSLNVHNKKNS